MSRTRIPNALLPLALCLFIVSPAACADSVAVRGAPMYRDDFVRCIPGDKILADENRRGYWNLRHATWGGNDLLHANGEAPDIRYDPRLKGSYDIEVQSRATHFPVGFALRLSSDKEFTAVDVPNAGATETRHFDVWMSVRKNVPLTGESIVLRCAGKPAYIDAFRFTPVSRYTPLRPLGPGAPGPVSGVLCKQPGRYIGWPTITRTAADELLVVFSGDRDAHVCPWGTTQLIRSTDGGRNWSAARTINNTPLDDRDAGIVETARGTLVVSWFTSLHFERSTIFRDAWRQHAAKLGPETRAQWLGHWVRRSVDRGRTWAPPSRTIGSAPHGPITLRDGRLLYVGTGGGGIVVEQSTDDGATWRHVANVPVPAGLHPTEPHAVECADGRLVALFRNEDPDRARRFLGQSESADGGRTWSEIHRTEIWGYPPHLLRLADGRLLLVYGHRRPPFGQRARLSSDGGRTWDPRHEIALVDDAPDDDLGYPSSTQLADGTILTIYYQKDHPDEPPCLMGTHWRLPDPAHAAGGG